MRFATRREWLKSSPVILILYSAYSRIVAQGTLSWPAVHLALRGRLSIECNKRKVAWHQLELWPDALVPASIYLVGCLWGGWLIYSSYQNYRRRTYDNRLLYLEDRRLGNTILEGVTKGWLLSGLAIAYLFSVFASIVLAYNTPAYMPYMTYGPTVEHRGEPKPNVNSFLSHTENQWYLLHRIPNDTDKKAKTWKPPDFVIVSLADSKVKHVRVRPNPPKASRVAPLLKVFGMKPPEKYPCKKGIE
jgi:hypothetical protein